MKFHLFIMLLLAPFFVYSQDLTVSDEILEELKTVQLMTDLDTFTFRVHYPKNYNPSKSYKCFIGLSGGDHSLEVVNYCYAAWFRSGYFDDYYTILPVVDRDSINFKDFKPEEILDLLDGIQGYFSIEPGWIIAGTSNGGDAAFKFVAADPERFEGLIVAPGKLDESISISDNWSHLKVVLAYGELDSKFWIDAVKQGGKKMKKLVQSIEIVELSGQGHILTISFNADKIYDAYFLNQ